MVHFRAFGARLFVKQNVGPHVIALEDVMNQAAKPGAIVNNGLAFFGPYGENFTLRTGLGDIEIQVPIKE
jgi:hypothetical protein